MSRRYLVLLVVSLALCAAAPAGAARPLSAGTGPPTIRFAGSSNTVFNPYAGRETWRFWISAPARVSVDVRRSGQPGPVLVRDLGTLSAGTHGFTWDGRTKAGQVVPAGWYWLHVVATNGTGAGANLAFGGIHVRPWIAPPALVAQAAFVLDDDTGRTLYAYHADTPRYPASTVKMMTAIVALQRLRPGAVVTVPPDAPVGGTTAGLYVGERMTVHNLLYGLLLPSGNDAAVTLADAAAGSVWSFSTLMNAEARQLRLLHSHFLGPHGLDEAGQYSTARDLAWLAHALLRRPLLAQIVHTRTYSAVSTDGRYRHVWTNLNQLLWSDPSVRGVKTGTTPLAGANLVAYSVRKGHHIISVIMGSTVASRYSDAGRLLGYAWALMGQPVG